MPFTRPLEEFEYHYVKVDPDLVMNDTPIVYLQPSTNRFWTVPAGNVSDGQSIPRWLWPVLGSPLNGQSLRAAFIHDYNYQKGYLPKGEIDRVFLEALREDKDEQAAVKFWGVRVFGWISWWRHRRQNKV